MAEVPRPNLDIIKQTIEVLPQGVLKAVNRNLRERLDQPLRPIVEPSRGGITTVHVEPEPGEHPPLPQNVQDIASASLSGLPNPHPDLGDIVPLDPKAAPIRLPGSSTNPAGPVTTRGLEAEIANPVVEKIKEELNALDPNQITDGIIVIDRANALIQQNALDHQTQAHLKRVGANPVVIRTWHAEATAAGKRNDLEAVKLLIEVGQFFGTEDKPDSDLAKFSDYLKKWAVEKEAADRGD